MKIFPAIDLKENKCVRLIKGEDNSSVVFNENPVLKISPHHTVLYLEYVFINFAAPNYILENTGIENSSNFRISAKFRQMSLNSDRILTEFWFD